jgi:hypothetical protein
MVYLSTVHDGSEEVYMTSPNQDAQAILREIVQDLEKITAGMTYIFQELNKSVQMGGASLEIALARTSAINKPFYDQLRAKIEALQITSEKELG